MTWQKLYNERVRSLTPSIIQEMRDLISVPGTISFAAGEPSSELYPVTELRSAFGKVLENSPELLAYASPAGDPCLREWISSWLYRKGYSLEEKGSDRILLTNGSQAGLNLLSLMFLEKGKKIVLEDPSYTEAMLTFSKEGVQLLTVPMDDEGPVPDLFEKVVREEKPELYYTIPTFQNPSGISVSEKRKLQILDIADRYGVRIIEDDPYRQLWFDSAPPSTYLALSEDSENIIYLGSFSKIIAPGIRCGYALLPPEVMKKAMELRVLLEIGLSSVLQRSVFEFLSTSDFEAHLVHLREVYRSRRDAMVNSLNKNIVPHGMDLGVPEGGFFIWGRIPGIDTSEFARFAAKEEKIGTVPGSGFFAVPDHGREFLRLSFAQVTPEEAEEGSQRLSRALIRYKGR